MRNILIIYNPLLNDIILADKNNFTEVKSKKLIKQINYFSITYLFLTAYSYLFIAKEYEWKNSIKKGNILSH